MKKRILKLTGLFALVAGLAVSCEDAPTDNEVDTDLLPIPTSLSSSAITATGATLTWDAVAGAMGYNVRIDDRDPVSVTSNAHTAEGLAPGADHTWVVQAFDNTTESEWSTDATFTTYAGAPTGLAATNVTDLTAILTWDAFDGATGYEVMINDNDPIGVEENSYLLTGLTADTEYNWTVRTLQGEMSSEWAPEASFVTRRIQFVEVDLDNDYGQFIYGAGVRNISVSFHSFHTSHGQTGYDLTMDLLATEIDSAADVKYLELPAATYSFDSSETAPSVIIGPDTKVRRFDNWELVEELEVTSGTMVVGKDGQNDVITFELTLENGETLLAEWGFDQLLLRNPYYEPPVEDHDLGTFPGIVQIGFMRNLYGDDLSDVWGVFAYNGEIGIAKPSTGDKITGNGKVLRLYMYVSPGADGTTIPDGEYAIVEGTHLPGEANAGVSFIENSRTYSKDEMAIVSGTANTAWSEETEEYTIVVDGKNARGESVKVTVRGNNSTI
ncbi:MAG: fibronectin type III domain-containing protein [Alistipes sp.]|jgi:hypothetical protein|nr:fibronectin type III domain-containing protein [Alistipes sp.]